MKNSRIILSSLAAISLLSLPGCVTDPNTGERKISRTALGGVGGSVLGGLLGSVIGGKTGRIVGAGVGGIAGGVVGAQIDRQIKELRETTEGSGIDISPTDDGNAILVNLPDGVTFDVASYTIKPAFRATLDSVGTSLQTYPDSLVDVYGHTDSTGSDQYNQVLSENRANAVANYLIGRGVNSARIRWQGFGESRPIADNTNEAGRALNRRVEIKIIPITQEDVAAARNSGG